jgi:large subunit ribosomal protein L4e
MFAPTKTWRKWHRKINTNQKRFAVASALAASALPSLVLARGHRISNVPEIPLVADSSLESISKTKQAISALKALGAYEDVSKAADSKKLRAGKGKMRNRRYVSRRGPLVVYKNDSGISRAFRNLPGVELAHVDSLNLLQLAPGGHLGRFIVWTAAAFERLVDNWGTSRAGSQTKTDYRLPRPQMTNSDLTRIINSDEVQSKVRPTISSARTYHRQKNPLTNFGVRVKLNPYAQALRRQELLTQEARKEAREKLLNEKRDKTAKTATTKAYKHGTQKSKNYNNLVNDGQFALSKSNSQHTGGFNVASRTQEAESAAATSE